MPTRSFLRTGRRDEDSPMRRISRSRDLFEEAVVKARLTKGWVFDQVIVTHTREEYRRMERLAESLQSTDDTFAQDEIEHLQMLARRRVYILPDSELEAEASTVYEEMCEWGVPPSTLAVLTELRNQIVTRRDRAALNRLLAEYAYWDGYIDWYNQTSTDLRWALLAGGVVLFFTSLGMALAGWVPPVGWALAGAAGAMFSVGFKVPPPTSYGEANALFNGVVFVRVVSGTVTSMVTLFLLAGNVVNVSIGQTPLPEIAHHCLDGKAAAEAVKKARSTKDAAEKDVDAKATDAVKAAEEKKTAEKDVALSPTDASAHDALRKATLHAAQAEDAKAESRRVAEEKTRAATLAVDGACNPPNLSLLLCIALLLGFSERSLSGLVGQVLGGGDPNAAPTPPRTLMGGGSAPDGGKGKTGDGKKEEGEKKEGAKKADEQKESGEGRA